MWCQPDGHGRQLDGSYSVFDEVGFGSDVPELFVLGWAQGVRQCLREKAMELDLV